jgi:hypothetical protein
MRLTMNLRALFLVLSLGSIPALAQVGAGNANAATLAQKSPAVQTAYQFLIHQAQQLQDTNLRTQTLDAISNPGTCIKHRANLTPAKQAAIVQQLLTAGLLDSNDASFPGGLQNGVFPPVLNDGTACPQLPMPFYAAPGSAFGSHHSYPGGLPIHESNNDSSDIELAGQYRSVYLHKDEGVVALNPGLLHDGPTTHASIFIDQDIIVGAPIWHDWAKPIVFQWNADGSEYPELSIGGNGLTDNNGAAGNSKTGGHHILSVAESMARGLSPAFVITQASAHSNPSLGNEYKVVNWIRAAAIIDGIDPVATGYLMIDAKGNPRLPALRNLGDIDLANQGQTNLLAEYQLHNLSDADFTYSIPAIGETQIILQTLAPRYGYDPTSVSVYNNSYRNPALSFLTGERILILYSQQGLAGVQTELDRLRRAHVI